MLYWLASQAVVLLHFLFIVFVGFGAVLALRNRRWIYLHLPALSWGLFVEFTNHACPLTELENTLRNAAGQAGYTDGFIQHYLIGLIYPAGLTREVQFALGLILIGFNLWVYARVWRYTKATKRVTIQ